MKKVKSAFLAAEKTLEAFLGFSTSLRQKKSNTKYNQQQKELWQRMQNIANYCIWDSRNT